MFFLVCNETSDGTIHVCRHIVEQNFVSNYNSPKLFDFTRASSVGRTGGSQSPASRFPYIFVPWSPDSRPLLCFSRYHVNHAV